MDPFENPFSPGAGTPPPAFIGREDLITSYGVALRRTKSGRPGKSVMPIGLRGVGKTVLLNRFDQMAREEGLAAAFIEAPETGDFKHLLAARLRSILLELDRGSVSQAVKRALGTLKSFSYALPDGTSISLNVDAIAGSADSGVLAEDTTELLVATGEAAKDRGRGLLLAIDEVQYLTADELAAVISAIPRTPRRSPGGRVHEGCTRPSAELYKGIPLLPPRVGLPRLECRARVPHHARRRNPWRTGRPPPAG